MAGVSQAFKLGQYAAPKTPLGFFALIVALTISGAVGGTWALAGTPALHGLLPWIWGGTGAVVILIVAIIGIAMLRDPTPLMLGQMTGKEFIDYRRLTQGDSQSGEFVDAVEVLRTFGKRASIARSGEQTKDPDESQ